MRRCIGGYFLSGCAASGQRRLSSRVFSAIALVSRAWLRASGSYIGVSLSLLDGLGWFYVTCGGGLCLVYISQYLVKWVTYALVWGSDRGARPQRTPPYLHRPCAPQPALSRRASDASAAPRVREPTPARFARSPHRPGRSRGHARLLCPVGHLRHLSRLLLVRGEYPDRVEADPA